MPPLNACGFIQACGADLDACDHAHIRPDLVFRRLMERVLVALRPHPAAVRDM
jgi:hypothetical protein